MAAIVVTMPTVGLRIGSIPAGTGEPAPEPLPPASLCSSANPESAYTGVDALEASPDAVEFPAG